MRDDGQIRPRAVKASYRFSALLVPIDVRLGTYLQSISPNRKDIYIRTNAGILSSEKIE